MTIASKDIQYVREDRLHKELSNLSYKRDRLRDQIRKEGRDEILIGRLMGLETQFCYIYRELEHRAARRESHKKFVEERNSKKEKNFRNNRDNRAKRRKNVV